MPLTLVDHDVVPYGSQDLVYRGFNLLSLESSKNVRQMLVVRGDLQDAGNRIDQAGRKRGSGAVIRLQLCQFVW